VSNQQPPKPPTDTKWYAVRRIYFSQPTSVPGGPARSELLGSITQKNVPRWTIEYAPSMRHHKITYYSTNSSEEPAVIMVPESRCTWEPM
jgi:hypothetical protein